MLEDELSAGTVLRNLKFRVRSSCFIFLIDYFHSLTYICALSCFYFFCNLQDKSLCAARKLFFTCHLKSFLSSFCWLLSYMKAKLYMLLFSLQLTRHLSFVRRRDVCCYSLLGSWGLELCIQLNRNFCRVLFILSCKFEYSCWLLNYICKFARHLHS